MRGLIIGAGIGGLMGSLKAAEEGAKVDHVGEDDRGTLGVGEFRRGGREVPKGAGDLISILLSCAMRSTVLRIGASTPAPSKRT